MIREGLIAGVLGEDYDKLPAALQDLHMVAPRRNWCGEASIQRGRGVFASIAGWIGGFSPESAQTRVEIEMIRTPDGETWIRKFGSKSFRSSLSIGQYRGRAVLMEQFGLFRFAIDLSRDGDRLRFPVLAVHVLGLALPKLLRPISETSEYVDPEGRPCFDVRITLPIGGLVAHYSGWLEPETNANRSHFS
ncbi:MAG: DUF4166 domain-containing protein [Pseudomonadota bacterium]